MNLILLLAIIGIISFIIYKTYNHFKHLKLDNVTMITGGVKTGKSTLGVYLSLKTYKKVLRQRYTHKDNSNATKST